MTRGSMDGCIRDCLDRSCNSVPEEAVRKMGVSARVREMDLRGRTRDGERPVLFLNVTLETEQTSIPEGYMTVTRS